MKLQVGMLSVAFKCLFSGVSLFPLNRWVVEIRRKTIQDYFGLRHLKFSKRGFALSMLMLEFVEVTASLVMASNPKLK